jgi:hypothetical protein
MTTSKGEGVDVFTEKNLAGVFFVIVIVYTLSRSLQTDSRRLARTDAHAHMRKGAKSVVLSRYCTVPGAHLSFTVRCCEILKMSRPSTLVLLILFSSFRERKGIIRGVVAEIKIAIPIFWFSFLTEYSKVQPVQLYNLLGSLGSAHYICNVGFADNKDTRSQLTNNPSPSVI